MCAMGPRAQATTSGTSSATVDPALGGKLGQGGAQGEAHAQAADQHARLGASGDARAGQARQRLLRAAEPAVHQLDRARHDRIFRPAPHQPQLAAGRDLGGVELDPGDHGAG